MSNYKGLSDSAHGVQRVYRGPRGVKCKVQGHRPGTGLYIIASYSSFAGFMFPKILSSSNFLKNTTIGLVFQTFVRLHRWVGSRLNCKTTSTSFDCAAMLQESCLRMPSNLISERC